MGKRQEYECSTCGSRAVVSGGPDVGMLSRTTTVGCHACGQLDDIVVATVDDGEAFFRDDTLDDDLPACRACGSSAVARWAQGAPCPKCGGPVTDTGGVIVLWD